MNIYDCANDLSKALRESHELVKLKEAKAVLDKDEKTKKLVNDFLKLNQEVELAKLQGKEADVVKQGKIQELYTLLNLNSDAQNYLNALMRFQMMMADINKAITDPIKDVMGDF